MLSNIIFAHYTHSKLRLPLAAWPGSRHIILLFLDISPGLALWPRESHPSVYVFDTRAGPRSGDKSLGLQLVTAQRFILGLTDIIYHAKYQKY